MASAFLTEAEARSARTACASVSTLEDLIDVLSEVDSERADFEARLERIVTRVQQGYILSEEEKEVLREASEREE
jgi:hypothetical protein